MTPLVGRDEEVARLAAALGAAGADGGAVAVVGEAGIGKSRLLAELAALAGERRWLALAGRAARQEREVPFGAFLDALDDHLAALHSRALAPLGPERHAELGRIFPALGTADAGGAESGAGERYRAYQAVRLLLELLAGRRPLLLTLDDLHWADPASVELLGYLLRRPPRGRVLLGLAYRPQQAGAELRAALAGRNGAETERIEPAPLTPAEAAELLGAGAEPALAGGLYEESGGNPFYLGQLWRGRAARAASPSAAEGEARTSVPRTIAEALADELGALAPGARKLLDGASVAGDPFDVELAAAAASLAEERALRELDRLLRAELVRPTPLSRRFRFRHPILHRAVYEATGEGWRITAHARVAAALAAAGAPPERRAHYVERSARAGDAAAIETLAQAARASATQAPAVAAGWLGAALALLPGQADPRRIELLAPMAVALASAGRLEESRAALVETLALLPAGGAPGRIGLVAACASLEHLLGLHDTARARLEAELGALPEGPSPEAVALQIELAFDSAMAGAWDEASRRARIAVDGARALAEPALLAAALGQAALAAASTGDVAEGARHLAEGRSLVNALPDRALGERIDALHILGYAAFFLQRYEETLLLVRRGLAVARAAAKGQLLLPLRAIETWCLAQLGRLDEAAALAEDAVEAARLPGSPRVLSMTLSTSSWVAAWRGELAAAIRSGEEAYALDASLDDSHYAQAGRAFFGVVCVEAGEWARGIEQLELAGAPEFPTFAADRPPIWCEALTRAELGRGSTEAAARWAERAEAFAAGLDLPVSVAAARRARAAVLLATGDPDGAARHALEAAELAASRGARVPAARARILAGRALAASGAPAAPAQLERALAELEDCGARGFADEARRELRRLGRRPPRRSGRAAAGAVALSAREREVAELVCAGRTNREIATVLHLSEKTVEKHLAGVFRKLGATNRAAAAARFLDASRE